MKLQHINIDDLKTTKLNVRKKGAKSVDDLLPSIRSLGIVQPLLVRPNCEGYEIVAGQRRYHAALSLRDEGIDELLPCLIMDEGDDAKAIEASLAENVARLPMDEIDQYKAFAALKKQGQSVEDIASRFGVSEKLVKQRLAITNLISPILTAYSKDKISVGTIRILTLATKAQQKQWWQLFTGDDGYAPMGNGLRNWLFGGVHIPVSNALFDISDYEGATVTDLFGDQSYFHDGAKFWELQNKAIAKAVKAYQANGWSDVVILDIGEYWSSWEYGEVPKNKGGKVYVQCTDNGEVIFHEGFLPEKQARRLALAESGEVPVPKADKPELTKAMQNYLDLHRHACVREKLLSVPDIALRLVTAQMIAGSPLWKVEADPQRADKDNISESLATNKAQLRLEESRNQIAKLLGLDKDEAGSIVPAKGDWQASREFHVIFARLLALSDEDVNKVLTFIAAETLACGSGRVEVLGKLLGVNLANDWSPDEAFFDLLRDKETINAMLKEVGGKAVADAHVASTAKVQKKIISDYLDGTRNGGKKDWQTRYVSFPMKAYTKRGGIEAIDRWKRINKCYSE